MSSTIKEKNLVPLRHKFLGVETNALSIPELNTLISLAVEKKQKWIISNHNLHSVYIYHRDAMMRSFYEVSEYIHIDGMPLILVGRLLGIPLKREQRVTYADWIWPLASDAEKYGWRIFYLGSQPGVAERGAQLLCQKYPNLQICTEHGYFDKAKNSLENQAILEKMRLYKPHVLMIGMGMPRQERWILENLDDLETNAILTSGACLDYVAGAIKTPPRWMGKVSLEWLYRLLTEPKRLWTRYLLEPIFILPLLIRDLWNMRTKS